MRGSVVALGVILMLVGFSLFVATAPEPIRIGPFVIGEERVPPTLKIAGIEFPLNIIGLFMAGLGFITFIAGIAASGKS